MKIFNSSDNTNAPVDDYGVITLLDKPAGEVVITATKEGDTDFEYKFNVQEFYSNNTNGVGLYWVDAKANCLGNGRFKPSREQLTKGSEVRETGSFWSEWGDMTKWGRSPSDSYLYTSTHSGGYIHGVWYHNGAHALPAQGSHGNTFTPYCYK